MKLSELLPRQQDKILTRLDNEQWSWDNSNIWWSKGEGKEAQDMIRWNEHWHKFNDAVRNDEEIEKAFCEWRYFHFGCQNDIPYDSIRTLDLNVPMYAFKEVYDRAKSQTEAFIKESLDAQK
jgi:hypothetical protein